MTIFKGSPKLVSIVRLSTPHMPNTALAFDDVILPLGHALRRLGYGVEFRVNSFSPQCQNICLGANYDPEGRWHSLPAGTIILNLEQLGSEGYPWKKDHRYFDLLAKHEVWDFSQRNIKILADLGLKAKFLPLGYVPEMTRLIPCPYPNGDVLFYGAMNPRRRQVLDELIQRGVKVNWLNPAIGQARDHAIYSTRIFLNIHHSLPASLEIVRLGYILANSRAVVSELGPDTYYYPELSQACAFAPYDCLVDTVCDLLADDSKLQAQAAHGFTAFKALKLEDALSELICSPQPQPLVSVSKAPNIAKTIKPRHLRAGSGCKFINQALNIDPEAIYNPDIVLDLATWNPEDVHNTVRFGEIGLRPASFTTISVPDLLARCTNPRLLMTVFLGLLEDQGHLILTLPYELAEESGRYLHSFNATFLDIYTTPRAYLCGWTEHRFEIESLNYELSDLGRILAGQGRDIDYLLRIPQAVVSFRAVLKKCPFSPEERTVGQGLGRNFYQGPAEVWQVQGEEGYAEIDAIYSPEILSPLELRLAQLREIVQLWRCRFHLRFGLGKGHGRYKDKVILAEKNLEKLRNLSRL